MTKTVYKWIVYKKGKIFIAENQEELISTFSDGKVDNLQTTLNIWQMLDFTPTSIDRVLHFMSKK